MSERCTAAGLGWTCKREHAARGLCKAHYLQHYRGRPLKRIGFRALRDDSSEPLVSVMLSLPPEGVEALREAAAARRVSMAEAFREAVAAYAAWLRTWPPRPPPAPRPALGFTDRRCAAVWPGGRCEREAATKGLCTAHYMRARRGISPAGPIQHAPRRSPHGKAPADLTMMRVPESDAKTMAADAETRDVAVSLVYREALERWYALGGDSGAALSAMRYLVQDWHTVDELAEELGCARHTASRLLGALERWGVPVRRQRDGRHVYLTVEREDVLRALGLG